MNYNDWTGKEVEGKKRPNLKQFKDDMAKRTLGKQTYEVDTIASATVSCTGWKLAVKRALEKAASK